MDPETVDPEPDRLACDDDPALSKQILNICRAQRQTVVRSDGVGRDLTREAEAFQALQRSWYFHDDRLSVKIGLINLAMPFEEVRVGKV